MSAGGNIVFKFLFINDGVDHSLSCREEQASPKQLWAFRVTDFASLKMGSQLLDGGTLFNVMLVATASGGRGGSGKSDDCPGEEYVETGGKTVLEGGLNGGRDKEESSILLMRGYAVVESGRSDMMIGVRVKKNRKTKTKV